MRILLPIKLAPTGGTSSFARKLRTGLARRGHSVSFAPESDFDLVLASPRAPWSVLARARWQRRPIIQRLDGVYYPATVAGAGWRRANLPLALIRRYGANQLVYQSHYARRLCQQWLGPTEADPGTIIYNGVDLDLFSPRPPASASPAPVFITWSRFRRRDQIAPLAAAFGRYRARYQRRARLVLIGNVESRLRPDWPRLTKRPGISWLGPLNHRQIAAQARTADVFVISHQNPPCPNNVIEAMACGLPICGLTDGAMPELVADGQSGRLLPVTGDGFDRPRPIDPDRLAALMDQTYRERRRLGQSARRRAVARFSLATMCQRYLELFARVLKAR